LFSLSATSWQLVINNAQFAPAANARTFADLQRQGLPMKRALALPRMAGHVCILGETALWTLPSGPPAYHFDEKGYLIDFTLDVGDSTLFQKDYDIITGRSFAWTTCPPDFVRQCVDGKIILQVRAATHAGKS